MIVALAWALPNAALGQLRFEAEDVSGPADAWVKDRHTDNKWNLWSTDKDAHLKWSGGVVLRSPAVMADRESPEEGAPPLRTVIADIPPGVYTVELKVGRVVGVSLDGTTWQRYSGGPLLTAHRVAAGEAVTFWVDDRFAMIDEAARGPAYYDYVLVHRQQQFEDGIPNADFELLDEAENAAHWNWWSRDGGGQALSVTDPVHSGTRAVRITHDGERDWAFTNSARLAVEKEAELCVRAWVRGAPRGQPLSIAVVGYAADGKLVSWQVGRGRAAMTGEWVQAKGFMRLPEMVTHVQVRFVGQGKTDAVVDSVSLEEEQIVFPDRPKVDGWATERRPETFTRGAVALPLPDGSVHLSWRLLAEDADDIAFDVFRTVGDAPPVKINPEPITQTTDVLDSTAPADGHATYTIRPAEGATGASGQAVRAEPGNGTPYVRIPLRDPETVFQKVALIDLNGDGVHDYVIKQPSGNIDPWHKYWHRSPETYKIEAYLSDGTFLWSNDLGWAIERGMWYSPYVAWDLTGNGRAEIAVKIGEGDPRDEDGKVTSGPEYIAIWDGMTGKEIARAPWPDRKHFDSYNLASRNQLAVAYLDGKTPCVIALRGTYSRMLVNAYMLRDGNLELLWEYDNELYGGLYWGQGAHFTQCFDLDGDGRDEIILGSAVLDDNGVPLWTTGRGHPDAFYLADILPDNPGLEIAYVMESRQRYGGGLNVVDARTGNLIWKLDEPTTHVHGKGMCADIDPMQAGLEVYGADADGHNLTENRWLFAADGTLLRSGTDCPWGFNIDTVYWDADLQKEIRRGGRVSKYQGGPVAEGIVGRVVTTADILGDWREEIITSVKGELRIYSTTIPAMDRRTSLMQDPVYRQAVTMNSMGYSQDPTLSYNPELRSPNLNVTCLTENRAEPVLQVVVSAPLERAVRGRVSLWTEADMQLDPAAFEVDVSPGERTVRIVSLNAPGEDPPQGLVHAHLEGPGVNLRGRAPVKMPGGFLKSGIILQAADFAAQENGEVQVRTDKANTMGTSISHWDDRGHALTWTAAVPEEGKYRLLLRYCAPHTAARRVLIDGHFRASITLPATGGFGNDPADWEHAPVRVDGRDMQLELGPGQHTIRLENTDGRGCNLDYIGLVKVQN